jgi:3-hydroxyisobutyrate dehydrogenase-like beta-hydroxyacid dehydrogenase
VGAGHQVYWASKGRSALSAQRAVAAGLVDAGTLVDAVAASEAIIAVCPPDAARTLAAAVLAVAPAGWTGVYLDANAIAPSTFAEIAGMGHGGDVRFVDGGIIGPPPTRPGVTRLYLSGADAPTMAELWAGSNLEAIVISDRPGDASALKLAYASWSKASQALLLTARAVASAQGVEEWLLGEWDRADGDLRAASERAAAAAATKGWRWSGEMREIAALLRDSGLPDGFHLAAAEVFAQVPRRAPTPTSEA